MRIDIAGWCHVCETCASKHVGKLVKLFLSPIPVGGPFDRVGVDIIKFPKSSKGYKYAVVYVDYLMK